MGSNEIELLKVLAPRNISEYAVLVVGIIFLIICAIIGKFYLTLKARKADVSANELNQLKTEQLSSDARIGQLERDIKDIRDHIEYISSKQDAANKEIIDRISLIKEKVAGMDTLVQVLKEQVI